MNASGFLPWLTVLGLACSAVPAIAAPQTLSDCANITAAEARLACFDQLAAPYKQQPAQSQPVQPVATEPAAAAPTPVQAAIDTEPSWMDKHWEIGAPNKRGTFQFRMHEANYLIAKYSSAPNNAPYQPVAQAVSGTNADLSRFELNYQLGFKMKVMEEGLPFKTDLWVAYTQKSFWQADNERASSPFRETNYTPEVIAVTPLDFSLLGMRARFVGLGLVHQSNGQSGSLSRSWNRAYAQLGLERGGLSIVARVWQRIGEPAATDDNPDITDYLGHGDLQATWRREGHEYSLLTRYNARTGRGAAQAGWAFPIAGKLKGYLQVFSGYGQSLIDYNHHESTFGLGVLMNY